MLAVQFGAGNIGRGFIGQLLFESGYDICFADVSTETIQKINKQHSYTIRFLNKKQKPILVNRIFALNSKDEEAVVQNVSQADLVTTAVGVNNLKYIAKSIADGILERIARHDNRPLNIIACENAICATTTLKQEVMTYIPKEQQQLVEAKIGFPDAAVDRIVVAGATDKDGLDITVEPFYEWDIDKTGLKGEKLPIQGVKYTDCLDAYIERKLFVVNAMHASMAYLGSLKQEKTTAEVAHDSEIMTVVRQVGIDSGKLLEKKYQIQLAETKRFQENILKRFANPAIADPLVRVGRAPIRKLSPKERLVSPYVQLSTYGIQSLALAKVIAAAFCFKNPEDVEAVKLESYKESHTMEETLEHFTGISATSPLGGTILSEYQKIIAK